MHKYTSKLVSKEFMDHAPQVIKNGLVYAGPEVLPAVLYTSNCLYHLPIQRNEIVAFGSISASPSHVGSLRNSVDFYCKEATQIFAAMDGKVVSIRSNKNVHGNTLDFWDEGNYIELQHSNREFTWYEHLLYNGVLVNVGENVTEGQLIGYSGNTGFSENPHLHFQAHVRFGSGEIELVTLRARFKDFENVYDHIGLKPLIRT